VLNEKIFYTLDDIYWQENILVLKQENSGCMNLQETDRKAGETAAFMRGSLVS